MCKIRAARPSPALVVAVIALIAAMGGTAYAGFSLPKGSVGAKQLKKNAVTTNIIKNGAVTGAKVAKNTITGKNIKLSTLGTVSNANHANTANSATNATTAGNATSLTGPLASGKTLVGRFGMAGDGPGFVQDDAISFQIPLKAAPAFNVIPAGGAPTTQCPGSVAAPAAAAGQLCLYVGVESGATGVKTASGGSPDKFGAVVFPSGTTLNTDYEIDGDWAVTGS